MRPQEIAAGVYRLSLRGANVYFVQNGSSWVVIDTAWAGNSRLIKTAAEEVFGPRTRPAAILLTHAHPDHAGSARELARLWGCPVYVHPDELPLATGTLSTFEQYPAGPLDRWLVLPLMRALPPRMAAAMVARTSLKDVAQALDSHAGIPGLPDWTCVPTPGHTPGHAAFFRARDRVVIAGDALLTIDLNSLEGLLWRQQRVAGPPHIATWSWPAAKESVAVLARLEPRVLAPGHGRPLSGAGTAAAVRAFAERFARSPSRNERSAAVGVLVGGLTGTLAALAVYLRLSRRWHLRQGRV